MRRLIRLIKMSAADRSAIVEAVGFLLLAQLLISVLPFRWIARLLGTFMMETLREDLDPGMTAKVISIRRNINRVAENIPLDIKCLQRSIAAMLMLRVRRIPATLYFCARKDAKSNVGFVAHAWVRAGRINVTPQGTFREQSIVAVFGS